MRTLGAYLFHGAALSILGLSLLLSPALAATPGTAVAWGHNGAGQTNVPAGLNGVRAIAAGGSHTVALKSDGTVVAWGRNEYGQANVPVGLSGVSAIGAGDLHTIALRSNGTVVAWGDNANGQGTIPGGLSGVTAIAAGGRHTVALGGDGTVVAWGLNGFGQTTTPVGLSAVTAIGAGAYHTVALKGDGSVVAWGWNNIGQTSVPAGLSGVVAIAAGGYHTVALKGDGTVVAWGSNTNGQTTVPAGLSGVTAIAAGGYHNVALKSDGTVVAWGWNTYGQTNVPAGLSGVSAIAAGGAHTVALRNGLAPAISAQPAALALNVTSNATFTVSANGDGPLAYQWRKDGVGLAGQTATTLSLMNVLTNQAGAYSVVITNFYGSVTSSVAVMTVNRLSQSLAFGPLPGKREGDPPFVLMVTNSTGLPVVFTSSDAAVASVIGNTVTVVGVGAATITATNDGSSTYLPVSVGRVLTVSGVPPLVSVPPASRVINVTSNATFTVTATSAAPLSYQWFALTPSLSGATGTALIAGGFVFDAQVVSGGTGYVQAPSVRFVGGGGSGATATATVSNGAVIALTIGSPGSGYTSPPTVQIDPPSGFLPGQTNAALTLTNVSLNDAGTYFVVVTNAYGSVTSSPATLTVNVPASITHQPQGAVLPFGSNASFTVGAAGTVPLSYQWFWQPAFARAAFAVPDVRNGFVVGAAVLSGGGYYFTPPAVQILAGSGSGATATATVSNGRVTAVNIASPGSGYPSNAVIQIDPPAGGVPQPLSGQNAGSLSLTAPGALASGSYFVVVTNAGGSATSSPALLRVLVPQRFAQPPERLGDGTFRLRFVAHDGSYLLTNDLATLEVWGSTNLANSSAWLRLTNGITVQGGQVQVDDADSPALPRRFYRVLTR